MNPDLLVIIRNLIYPLIPISLHLLTVVAIVGLTRGWRHRRVWWIVLVVAGSPVVALWGIIIFYLLSGNPPVGGGGKVL